MEVTQALEFKNSSLTSNLIKHFSPLSRGVNVNPMNHSKSKYYQGNVSGQPSKRPTRCNLPKHSTNILKEWLLRNWHNPYPTEEEKNTLTQATKLKVGQVNNWLINARRRLLPNICLEYGLDHSKCKITKRGGNRGSVIDKLRSDKLDQHNDSLGNISTVDRCSQSSNLSAVSVVDKDLSPNITYKIILKVPDSPEHPTMLDYLADVMLMNEELEKSPNNEGLSRMELLCRRGLGERMHPCSP